MTLIHWCLGRFILLADMLYRPSSVSRSAHEQLSKLSLYQYTACPFCVKVRWAMRRLPIDIEARNPKINAEYKVDLLTNGGQLKEISHRHKPSQSHRTGMRLTGLVAYCMRLTILEKAEKRGHININYKKSCSCQRAHPSATLSTRTAQRVRQ